MDSSKTKIFFKLKKVKRQLANFFVRRFWRRARSRNLQTEINQQLVYTLAPSKLPSSRQFRHLRKFLNPKENLLIKICALIILVNVIFLGIRFYNKHLELIPASGGDYSEGLVGYPKTINPLYAQNRDVDSDLSSLIYSRLFTHDKQGQIRPDLVDSFTVSPDGLEYTLKLKNNATWHNGDKLNADDILFTFSLIQDPEYRSPLNNSFVGITLEKVDDLTIKFTLPQAYAPFPELLTFGILPSSLWSNISPSGATLSDLNLKPIGSGPFKFKSLVKNKNGEIKEYHLIVNEDYYGAKPYLKNLIFKFFPDENELIGAFNDGQFDGLSYLPLEQKKNLLAQNSLVFHELSRPQINAVFLNPAVNKSLADKRVRQALALAVDKQSLINNTLNKTAVIATGPILPSSPYYNKQIATYDYNPEAAINLLKEALTSKVTKGSGKNKQVTSETATLNLTLTIVGTSENVSVANQLKIDWERIGVKVTINSIAAETASELVRTKNYQALLYGEVVGADPDVYVFWHSSQSGDKGLNLSNYSNLEVDKLLASGRVTLNFDDRLTTYKKFQELIATDEPAIFLYVPSYSYVQTKGIKGFSGTNIIEPADRFSSINGWYLKTSKKLVW